MSKKFARKRDLKNTRLALSVLALVLVLVLLAQTVSFTKMFFRPWNLSKIDRVYEWDERFNINLVLKAESIAVLSLNPTHKQASVIIFPDNTFMDVAGKFGKWQLRSVYSLGQSNDNRGSKLLEQTLANFLGVPIDGFLEFKGNLSAFTPAEIIQRYNQNIISGILDLPHIRTDLTLLELVRLKLNLVRIRFDKIKTADPARAGVLDREKLNDGTEVFTADPAKLDSALADFADPLIRNEQAAVAIFNATNYPQLAQKAARLVTNLGGNVIVTANAEKQYSKTQVIGTGESATLARLLQAFDLGCTKDPKCVKICKISERQAIGKCVGDRGVEDSRAQINIILGEDFYARQ